MDSFDEFRFDDEGFRTDTSIEQNLCEKECCGFLRSFVCYDSESMKKFLAGGLVNGDHDIRILRSKHIEYLRNYLEHLPGGFVSLDASRSWVCYWIIHALYLLSEEAEEFSSRVISTLNHFQNWNGGFGGGPQQISQGAPNYAAVLTLCIIGTEEALSTINRPAMYQYFLRMKNNYSGGGLCIHDNGEVDSRGTYTIIAIARLLNILTTELADGVAEYLLACQTYEGGFGGEPGNEAHGGYNFCALAALSILGRAQDCDLVAQESWLLRRQSRLEGGFNGRTNKLVDACYSFWQGAAIAQVELLKDRHRHMTVDFPMDDLDRAIGFDTRDDLIDLRLFLQNQSLQQRSVDLALSQPPLSEMPASEKAQIRETLLQTPTPCKASVDDNGNLCCNQAALQRYILHCAQNVENGGLRDKPGKSRDFYHSCYALSGLSVAQQSLDYEQPVVYGDIQTNLVQPTSVVFNIGPKKLYNALRYYYNQRGEHARLVKQFAEQQSNTHHK